MRCFDMPWVKSLVHYSIIQCVFPSLIHIEGKGIGHTNLVDESVYSYSCLYTRTI